jgi:hypothetical protein
MNAATLEERKALLAAVGNPYGQPWATHHPIFAVVDQIIERVTNDLVGPCSGCSPMDGPEEDCPRHGRKVTEVWAMQQDALSRLHRAEARAAKAISVLNGEDEDEEESIDTLLGRPVF